MERFGRFARSLCFYLLALSLGLVAPKASLSDEPDPAAVAFGSHPAVWNARLSPDGKRVVYLRMHETDLPVAEVYDIEQRTVKLIVASTKDEFDLTRCQWATNDRLLCSFYAIYQNGSLMYPVTRLVGVDADGTSMKVLLQEKLARQGRAASQFQDAIIDLLPSHPEHVLIAIRKRGGKGVYRLNIESGSTIVEERPYSSVGTWMTDKQGKVRIRARSNGREFKFEARAEGTRNWHLIHEQKLSDLHQRYEPISFGEEPNDLFVRKPHEGRQALWLEDLSGERAPRLIFSHPDVDVSRFLEMRTGRDRRLVAVGYVTDRPHYHFFDKKLARVHERIEPYFDGHSVKVFDESWDGRFYLLAVASEDFPSRLFRFDSESNELLPLVDRFPGLRGWSLAPMKSLAYPARDGTLIPAYLTTPLDRRGSPYPTVVLPHGGPRARDMLGYDWLPQYLAARGYQVLQMNYRGSSGLGEDWVGEGGFRDWRTALNDITDGAQYLVDTGKASPERLCIVGWSYGGYAALLSGIEEPDLYRCVVSIAGVSDLRALAQEWKKYGGGKRFAKMIGSDSDVLRAGSPARRAKEMGAPTLLFHGDEDINVRLAQSKKMHKALKRAGKEVTFIEYEEVEHSLRRNAVRIDMLERIGDFLDTHTQPRSGPEGATASVASAGGGGL